MSVMLNTEYIHKMKIVANKQDIHTNKTWKCSHCRHTQEDKRNTYIHTKHTLHTQTQHTHTHAHVHTNTTHTILCMC